MADYYYLDLAATSDGAGTEGDQWQLNQLIDDNLDDGDVVYVNDAVQAYAFPIVLSKAITLTANPANTSTPLIGHAITLPAESFTHQGLGIFGLSAFQLATYSDGGTELVGIMSNRTTLADGRVAADYLVEQASQGDLVSNDGAWYWSGTESTTLYIREVGISGDVQPTAIKAIIDVDGPVLKYTGSTPITISGIAFQEGAGDGLTGHANIIQLGTLAASAPAVITDCDIRNPAGDGGANHGRCIQCSAVSGDLDGLTVTGCTFQGPGIIGSMTAGGDGITIADNVHHSSYRVWTDGTIDPGITGSTVHWGLLLTSSSGVFTDVSITDCTWLKYDGHLIWMSDVENAPAVVDVFNGANYQHVFTGCLFGGIGLFSDNHARFINCDFPQDLGSDLGAANAYFDIGDGYCILLEGCRLRIESNSVGGQFGLHAGDAAQVVLRDCYLYDKSDASGSGIHLDQNGAATATLHIERSVIDRERSGALIAGDAATADHLGTISNVQVTTNLTDAATITAVDTDTAVTADPGWLDPDGALADWRPTASSVLRTNRVRTLPRHYLTTDRNGNPYSGMRGAIQDGRTAAVLDRSKVLDSTDVPRRSPAMLDDRVAMQEL